MTNADIRARLDSLAEPDFQAFTSRLMPGVENVLGVRLPALRRLARELAQGNFSAYLQAARDDSYEETMLQGMVIGYAPGNPEALLPFVSPFVEKLDNWSTCDSFCVGLKMARSHPGLLWDFILPYLSSPAVFPCRFGIVMLLWYYIDAHHIDQVLTLLASVEHEAYYVRMAVAWAISMCYVAFPLQTETLLISDALDDFIHAKSLQKIMESRQISPQAKARIRAMKRKR